MHTATTTCTQLPPETIPDNNWLDDRLVGIIKQCAAVNYSKQRYNLVMNLLDAIDGYLQKASSNLFVKQAHNIINDIANAFLEELPVEDSFIKNSEKIERLAIFERVTNIHINILIAIVKYSETLNKNHFEHKIAAIDWKLKSYIYNQGFLFHHLNQIETFQRQLSFEMDCEKTIISPNWYLTELVVLSESRVYAECINAIMQECIITFKKWADVCYKKNRFWLSAAIQSRELEYWNKIEYHFQVFENAWNNLLNEKHIQGLLWPTIDFTSLKDSVLDRQKQLLGEISKQSNLLSLSKRPEDFPDYGGQYMHFTAHSVLRAICEPDEKLLTATFRPFFCASITKFQELRPNIKPEDWRFENQFIVAAAPILDLLEICGYAKLMSAVYSNPILWEEINKTWIEYLSDKDTPKDIIKLFAICVNITDSFMGITYRGITRTSWQQYIERILQALPRETKYHNGISFIPYEVVKHHDPLVRVFAKDRMCSFYDGIDVFISEFIDKNDEYKELEFGHKRERLTEDIEREKNRREDIDTTNEEDE